MDLQMIIIASFVAPFSLLASRLDAQPAIRQAYGSLRNKVAEESLRRLDAVEGEGEKKRREPIAAEIQGNEILVLSKRGLFWHEDRG